MAEDFNRDERITPEAPRPDMRIPDAPSPDQTGNVERNDFRRNAVDNWQRIGLPSWRPIPRSVGRK